MDDLHRQTVRKYHTLCSLLGLTLDDKEAILAGYGVDSSLNMETHDLIDVCGDLQKRLDQQSAKGETMDNLRKRCLRAICDYNRAKGTNPANPVNYAKQMACRAGSKEDFNRLTAAELRGVIGYFNSERKAFEGARSVATNPPATERPATVYYFPLSQAGEA